ncbi:MAG: preprotein translocase subunit SecY [bacterium]|nr:preprotein translocase subunit SecY [bacterium]
MFQRITLLFSSPDLRKKILFIIGVLIVFRFTAAISIPGVDPVRLKMFLAGSQFFGLFNVFSGGVLENLSIVMLGVGPYITSSIIMQLMTMIIPRLKEIYQEEGEAGRERFNQYSRLLTVPLALLQSYGLLVLLMRQQVIPPLALFVPVWGIPLPVGPMMQNMLIATAGSLLLMWLGELITERGLGNGVSFLIFAGIVAGVPKAIGQELFTICTPTPSFPYLSNCQLASLPVYSAFLLISAVVIAGVIIVSEGQRNVPVSYAKRVRGNRVYGGVSTHLPLRVNQAGVIPIIFAVSLLLFPGLLGSFFAGVANPTIQRISHFLVSIFDQRQFLYGASYFFLVFLFTYFYTAVTFDPQKIADNVQKQGGFILGVRPGRPTAEYLMRILNRITLAGGLFLGIIAILPLVVQAIFEKQTLSIGGTALLIVVSVVLETMKQVEAQVAVREYEQ